MLVLTGIRKRFGKTPVLDGVSLEAPPGRCVCVAGGNAAGKTTLLSIAAGLLEPDGGTVQTDGRIGFVAQDAPVLSGLTVEENLRLWHTAWPGGGKLFSPGSPERLLGLEAFRKTRAERLSGGVRRRLCIAAALAGEPKTLLLDEPFASLDAVSCDELAALLRTLLDRGVGMLLTSHRPDQIAAVADEAVLLENGKLTRRIAAADGEQLSRGQVLSLMFGESPAGACE